MKTLVLLASLLSLASSVAARQKPPNILLILADDLGFSDIGCYGSEIPTPNLDRLASRGVRFSQFYNTAKCHSSRVSLLTGRWCRQAGDESMRRAVTLPEILGSSGYFTAMAGKWHLSGQPGDFGFERFFGHLSGATNYYTGDKTFRLNGVPWDVPKKGFYTTVANVDHAIDFLGEARATGKPWFLYLAFNAPHAPLQPLKEDYERHLGRYDSGWDVVRAARVEKQRKCGLFPDGFEPSPRPAHIPAWNDLTDERRSWESRRMTALAAMIDRMDREIGRLIGDIEAKGELDNTMVMFFSDNGACPYDRQNVNPAGQPYDPDVRWSDSTGWAWVRNTPFRFYKQNQFEGGIATPAILTWPAGPGNRPGSADHTPAHLVDVLPTLADIAGAGIPDQWPGREPTPLAGISLKPVLAGGKTGHRPPIHLMFAEDRGLRDGDWKIVSFRKQPWELYDISRDRTELKDLAPEHPEIVERMSRQWHEMAVRVLMAPPRECAPVDSKKAPQVHPEWTDFSTAPGGRTRKRGSAADSSNE